MEIFISNWDINKDSLLETLVHKRILCNVHPYSSIVYSTELKKHVIQEGFKIDITKQFIFAPGNRTLEEYMGV